MAQIQNAGRDTEPSSRPTRLTLEQASRHCRVRLATLRRWIADGKLPVVTTRGQPWRIDGQDFRQFVETFRLPPYPARETEVRALIVEDDLPLAAVFAEVLRWLPRPIKPETASDGYEALIKVGAFRPTLVILDAVLPGVNGLEICRRLKADPATRSIRILGVSGWPELATALKEAGAEACLTKPMTLREVETVVNQLLAAPPHDGGRSDGKDSSPVSSRNGADDARDAERGAKAPASAVGSVGSVPARVTDPSSE